MRFAIVSRGRYIAVVPVKYARRALIAVGCALLAAMAWFFAIAPALVVFAVAVAIAVAWCMWLEQHPDPAIGSEPAHGAEDSGELPSGSGDESPAGARRRRS